MQYINKESDEIFRERDKLIKEGQRYLQYRLEIIHCLEAMESRAYSELAPSPDYYNLIMSDEAIHLEKALRSSVPVLKALGEIFGNQRYINDKYKFKQYKKTEDDYKNIYYKARYLKERAITERHRASCLAHDEFKYLKKAIRTFFEARYGGNTSKKLANLCGYSFDRHTLEMCFNLPPLGFEKLWEQIVEHGYCFISDEIISKVPD